MQLCLLASLLQVLVSMLHVLHLLVHAVLLLLQLPVMLIPLMVLCTCLPCVLHRVLLGDAARKRGWLQGRLTLRVQLPLLVRCCMLNMGLANLFLVKLVDASTPATLHHHVQQVAS